MQDKYCSNCGSKFLGSLAYPIKCETCGTMTWKRLPTVVVVAVPILPTEDRKIPLLMAVERVGSGLALPGGYQEAGETWQQAAAREVREETGVDIYVRWLRLKDVVTVEDGSKNLILCTAANVIRPTPVADGVEIKEIRLLDRPEKMVFPIHTRFAERFFGEPSY